ncbi:hypothetical protein QOL99_16475 [Deinococcus sp. MIMF12]|uniref:Uncharacterized protein n=1 Tax=Deinococcus rhizophilus TaxID=3049544 RepID=A0ABT7JKY3_9DEIO|nr:hypothetical protein [Deinococcus rhizophilus]MDL2345730.1 hypothetical protein [Deinococcus rhizophilus]
MSAPPLDITLAHGTPGEEKVRGWLLDLTRQHSLEPLMFCRRVVIGEQARGCQARLQHGEPELLLYTELLARLKPLGYRFIYREVAGNAEFLRDVVRRHGLTVG